MNFQKMAGIADWSLPEPIFVLALHCCWGVLEPAGYDGEDSCPAGQVFSLKQLIMYIWNLW